jgi:hypothetical protein
MWLSNRRGVNRAAILLNKYLAFFMDMENRWSAIPKYEVLISHYGAESLRSNLQAIRWMQASGLIEIDQRVKQDDSYKRRTIALLKKIPTGSPGQLLLDGYYEHLLEKNMTGAMTWRSICSAITPALRVILMSEAKGLKCPDQSVINEYLTQVPGQRNSVSRFVSFLVMVFKCALSMPRVQKTLTRTIRVHHMERDLFALLQRHQAMKSISITRWTSLCLAYFHGLPPNITRNIPRDNITINSDGIVVTWQAQEYWLPSLP